MVKIEELYDLLCSDGFLPPRDEKELLETEKRMADYQFKNDKKHVNTQAIINGTSCEVVSMKRFDEGKMAESLGMAARNFENLPQSVIVKIVSQHKKNDTGSK